MIDATLTGPVGRVVLNSPATHNALDFAALIRAAELLEEWAERPDLRAVVVTGTGRSFCSGVSLGDVAEVDWSDNPLTRLCDRLEAFPAPTIAALNGGVYGGGVEIALSCDFRVGVIGMKAFAPPARLGIHYEAAGIARAVQRLGPQMARRLFLLAESFDGDQLLAAGFIDHLVAPKALEEKVAEMTGTLETLAPLAVRGMKRTILEISRGVLDTEAAKARVAACFASADHAEGLAAQREKRPAKFTGH
ncbi:MAG: enoyl-CoA hydratase-related protein [Amaricoccus sp.]|uniref:enoyl-CoA hydratase/isomerase family protein n=1 Tax=Amaricoccus sp. TaxID=1872485 RepID=UPI0033156724